LRKTRSRSTTRIEKPISSDCLSRLYLSVEIMFAPREFCCALGTGSSSRSEGASPLVLQKASVASSRVMTSEFRSCSRRRLSRNVSSTLPPFHQHVLRLVHIITSFASDSIASFRSLATRCSAASSFRFVSVLSGLPSPGVAAPHVQSAGGVEPPAALAEAALLLQPAPRTRWLGASPRAERVRRVLLRVTVVQRCESS